MIAPNPDQIDLNCTSWKEGSLLVCWGAVQPLNCKISLPPSPDPREWHPRNALSSVSGMFLNPFGKCQPSGVARRLCWTAGPVRPPVTMEQTPKVQPGPGPCRCGHCLGPWTPSTLGFLAPSQNLGWNRAPCGCLGLPIPLTPCLLTLSSQ